MAVRRLHPDQPTGFAFEPANLAWAKATIAKYPAGKQASAVIPLLWRAQEQLGGWITEPALRYIAEMLDMAYIRVYEVATFYTMFQLAPVGRKAHVQVCGTTPCMLRGSNDLIAVCKKRIAHEPHTLSADGDFSWEEVECLGSCANAPMVEIGKDTYEDLTPELLEKVLDGFAAGLPPKPGSQIGRTVSCPEGGPTSLSDPTLYDGSRVGAWRKRFEEDEAAAKAASVEKGAVEVTPAPALASPAHKQAVAAGTSPSSPAAPTTANAASTADAPAASLTSAPAPQAGMNTAAAALMANAGLVPDLEKRASGSALPTAELERLKMSSSYVPASSQPPLLAAARDGNGDDLKLIWGVGETLERQLNALGIWHFDQIAAWGPAEVAWFEAQMKGFNGRIARDKWIEQCAKLATGWRPGSDAGERPKD